MMYVNACTNFTFLKCEAFWISRIGSIWASLTTVVMSAPVKPSDCSLSVLKSSTHIQSDDSSCLCLSIKKVSAIAAFPRWGRQVKIDSVSFSYTGNSMSHRGSTAGPQCGNSGQVSWSAGVSGLVKKKTGLY